MKTKNATAIGLLAALFAAGGCSKETIRAAEATPIDEEHVNVVFDDGTTAATIEEYEAAVENAGVEVTENSSFYLTVSPTGEDPLLSVGKFRLRILLTDDYIGGCISQKMAHLAVEITKENVPFALVELHLAGWFKERTPCLGLYNASAIAHGLCYKGCFSDMKKGIKTAIGNGLRSAGVGATVATISAALVAPIAARALAPLAAAAVAL